MTESDNRKADRQTCPRCGRHNTSLHALSRKDNRTMVCDSCGVDEALQATRNL